MLEPIFNCKTASCSWKSSLNFQTKRQIAGIKLAIEPRSPIHLLKYLRITAQSILPYSCSVTIVWEPNVLKLRGWGGGKAGKTRSPRSPTNLWQIPQKIHTKESPKPRAVRSEQESFNPSSFLISSLTRATAALFWALPLVREVPMLSPFVLSAKWLSTVRSRALECIRS